MSRLITDLLPVVADKAKQLQAVCKSKGINIIYTHTYRSIAEQDALYAQGRTKPGNVVTNARGGQSFHNYRVAFDFAPVVNGKIPWDNKALFTKVGIIAEKLGLEWGGRWVSFLDLPHLQYTLGHPLSDFQKGKVDLKKFNLK